MGTGCNACYTEKGKKITSISGVQDEEMIMVTEWENIGVTGALDDLFTEFDHELHEMAVSVLGSKFAKRTMGYLIAGRWLGQQVRIILKKLQRLNRGCNSINFNF